MPELPDVELQRRFLLKWTAERRIASVSVVDAGKVLTGTSGAELDRELSGRVISGAERIGKYLVCAVSDDSGAHPGAGADRSDAAPAERLVFHFGMTGYLAFSTGELQFPALPEKTKARFSFDDGSALGFVNMRLLGSIFLITDLDAFRRAHEIGPDALSLSREEFRNILTGRGSAKSTLMNQKKLSGIGNVYSDEILFHAGIHPKRKLRDLSDEDRNRLYDATHHVLNEAVERQADPARFPSTWLTPHRTTGTGRRGSERGSDRGETPRTGDGVRIEKIKIGGRSAFFAPDRQK